MLKSIYHDTLLAVEALKADADNETLTGAGVDMQGFEGVAFILVAGLGEVASWSIKAQEDSDSAFGTAADLEGTATTLATAVATERSACWTSTSPGRYVRPVVTMRISRRWRRRSSVSAMARVMPQTNWASSTSLRRRGRRNGICGNAGWEGWRRT